MDSQATYTLLMIPEELAHLGARLNALIRPYIAATRDGALGGADMVALSVYAFRKKDKGEATR
jgi:hypothetical protein